MPRVSQPHRGATVTSRATHFRNASDSLPAMTDRLSAREAADLCQVSEPTVRNWISAGKVPAEKTPEESDFLVRRGQIGLRRR